jgi:small subunit ribosomal protein S29e
LAGKRKTSPAERVWNLTGDSVVTGDKKKSGIIRKYGINMSRQAFREKAADIGFVKVSWGSREIGERGRLTLRSTVEIVVGRRGDDEMGIWTGIAKRKVMNQFSFCSCKATSLCQCLSVYTELLRPSR